MRLLPTINKIVKAIEKDNFKKQYISIRIISSYKNSTCNSTNVIFYRIKPARGSPNFSDRKDTHRRLPTLLRSSVPYQARGSCSWSRRWHGFFVSRASSSSCIPTSGSY